MSDEQGQWSFNQAPRSAGFLTFFVTHPDYARLMATLPTAGKEATNAVFVMPAGNYRLELGVTQPPADPLNQDRFLNLGPGIGSATQDVVVPVAEQGHEDEPLDLGTVTLPVRTASGGTR